MTVSTPAGSWVIPPHRALWITDGAPASVHTRGRVAVRTLYIASSLRSLPAQTRAVNVPPLVRELLLHAVRSCPLDLGRSIDAALLTVLLDQLRTLPDAPLQLPRPLGAWRRRARILRALELLATGTAVTATAATVGYATPSSFVASFKQELGHPPGRLLHNEA